MYSGVLRCICTQVYLGVYVFRWTLYLTIGQQARVLYELSFIHNEGELSNCFSI